MENGAVQIYYGEGHGKTNVAIGSAICAACDGKQAVVIQFLKGKKEPEFLKKLEPEVKFFNFSRAGILFEQPDDVTVIMTGRVLDDGIREMADEIYNIASEK